ncbi:MAG TPA: hypothetical protein VN181_15335 [Thermoanaerobaculia bacterium]|nr:hypothetical protein [Thermoanaerobaculia bacterium]
MKRLHHLLAVALIIAGCASGNSSNGGPPVELDLAQIGGGAQDTFYFRGPVNVQYRLAINNPTNEPLTLRRISLQTIGSGAYVLNTGVSPIQATVPPNASVQIPLSAWGRARGGFMTSTEPVTVRALAYFDSPHGSFVKQATKLLSQFQ